MERSKGPYVNNLKWENALMLTKHCLVVSSERHNITIYMRYSHSTETFFYIVYGKYNIHFMKTFLLLCRFIPRANELCMKYR